MSFLKRFGKRGREHVITDRDSLGEQDADGVLADDDDRDPFSVSISGTLDLAIPEYDTNAPPSPLYDTPSPNLILDGQLPSQAHTGFEVTSAEIIREQRSSYVLYTIMVSCHAGVERVPTAIDRRYSDFDKLHSQLKRKYPLLIENVYFPKKVLVGNFSNETIAHRSRTFEQYLTHIFSVDELRYSNEIASFFYLTEAKEGCSLLCNEEYVEAIAVFEKCLPISEKLYGAGHLRVVSLLHALVVCFHAIEKLRVAQKYAEVALRNIKDITADEPSIALIKLSIRLCWSLGKDKQDLEKKLQEFKAKKINVDQVPDLKDIVKLKILV